MDRMNACARCLKKRQIPDSDYCSQCLCRIVENRVKKTLSKIMAGQARKKARFAICCARKRSLQGAVAKQLIACLNFRGAQVVVGKKGDASTDTAGEIALDIIEIFSGIKKAKRPESIFERVQERELKAYANIKSIKYAPNRNERSRLKKGLEQFQGKYPGTIESIVRFGKSLKNEKRADY